MIPGCPNASCPSRSHIGPEVARVVRNGFFFRSSDSRSIQRFLCRSCGKHFSRATGHPCFSQKKRRINFLLGRLLCSGVSQRRAARILRVNPKTVVRKFRFLAGQAQLEHQNWLSKIPPKSIQTCHFDDLETAEHTKCKPLSVALAVDPNMRKILGFQVSQMPAKGLLARIARKKYGARKDLRPMGWDRALGDLRLVLSEKVEITSDENPHYPKFIQMHFPHSRHIQVKGGRGSISGQGELKKLRFDPIFALNHTCAMLRANLNRLFRRTWCISKTRQGLIDHLWIYTVYHNTVLTPQFPRPAPISAA
jgi:transposase-like protein